MAKDWKSKFLYRCRPEGVFRFFFGLILDPPRYICFYSEKRRIHLYRPFFSPWHGLFRKKGGTGAPVYVFIVSERKNKKHKEIWRDSSSLLVDMSRLSCGNVPFVPRTLCPTYVGLHKSGRDVPDVPGLTPKPSPGHFRGRPTTKFLYAFFVYRFSSP